MLITNKFTYPELKRIDSETDGRKYLTPDGELLPSVTTILAATKSDDSTEALKRWEDWVGNKEAAKILKESGDVGTLVHRHLECHINGEERPGGSNLIRVQAKKLSDVIIEKGLVHVSEVWGSEVALYEKGRSAGTTDAVGIYKDKASIIDFKNSRKVKKDDYVYDYLTQLAAYIKMHNCMFGTDIKNGAILLVVRGNDKGKDFGEFQSWELSGLAFQEHLDDWNRRVDLYYSKHNQ